MASFSSLTSINLSNVNLALFEELKAAATAVNVWSGAAIPHDDAFVSFIRKEGEEQTRTYIRMLREAYPRAFTAVTPTRQKCVCPIKDLTSIGHNAGCPEARP